MIYYNIFLLMLFASTLCFIYKKQFKRGLLNSLLFLTFFLSRHTHQDAMEIIVRGILDMKPIYWLLAIGNILLTFIFTVFPAEFILMFLCLIRVAVILPTEINLSILAMMSLTTLVTLILVSHCGKNLSITTKLTVPAMDDQFHKAFHNTLNILIGYDMFMLIYTLCFHFF